VRVIHCAASRRATGVRAWRRSAVGCVPETCAHAAVVHSRLSHYAARERAPHTYTRTL
jgi:hypothetical protein